MLWNMVTGEAIGVSAVTNPQSVFGADVISRINYASESQTNLETMQNKIINCFNEIIEGFELSYRIETDKIYEMTVVGNTTMSHLLMGVNPEQLAMAPFQPVFCTAITNNALEMGFIINPLANIHILPNIAGHVGSDIICLLYTSDAADEEDSVDLGGRRII